MSLAATYPRLLEMEQKFGSMIGGFVDARKKVAAMKKKYPPKPGEKPRTFFTSFTRGHAGAHGRAGGRGRARATCGPAPACASIARDGERLARHARRRRGPRGGRRRRRHRGLGRGGAARRAWTPTIGEALAGIPHSSSATVSLAFDTDDVGFDLNAFGVLCPMAEQRRLMACTLHARRSGRGARPTGKALHARVRRRTAQPEDHGEDRRGARRDRRAGVPRDPRPEGRSRSGRRVYRWTNGMPQYTLGHLDRVDAIEQRRAAHARARHRRRRATAASACRTASRAARRRSRKVLGDLGHRRSPRTSVEEKRYY